MVVWVTRTEPGASRLAARLASLGYSVLNAPVLGIVPTSAAVPGGCFDFVLFVSEHAVRLAFASGVVAKRLAPRAAGIGAGAEAALRRRGVAPALCGVTDAAAVTRAFAVPPARTLVVKGEGGRDVVQNWLRSRDKAVQEWNVYRRLPRVPKVPDDMEIDAIVVGSGDGLREVTKIWFASAGNDDVRMLVPSMRVARLAAASGFVNVAVAKGAGDDAVVAALRRSEFGRT